MNKTIKQLLAASLMIVLVVLPATMSIADVGGLGGMSGNGLSGNGTSGNGISGNGVSGNGTSNVPPVNQELLNSVVTSLKAQEQTAPSSNDTDNSAPVSEARPTTIVEIVRSEATVGSKLYEERQTYIAEHVDFHMECIKLWESMPTNPEAKSMLNYYKKNGFEMDFGGCTTLSPRAATALITHNTIPYNVSFSWGGLVFSLKIPAGADIKGLVDANGNIQMWKLVQKYGITNARLLEK